MAIDVRTVGNISQDPSSLIRSVRETFHDLEDQLNNRAQVYVSTDGRIPAGLNRNDIIVLSFKGRVSLLIKNARGFDTLSAGHIGGLVANGTNFLGLKSAAAVPVVTDFPETNDWGFFNKTNAVTAWYLCFNFNGVLKKVALT